jgi:predicted GNAT family acetyltransferase
MRVERHPDIQTFWRTARDFLERDEMGNTQVLSIGARYATTAEPSPPAAFTIESSGTLCGAALLTTKGTLFVSPSPPLALRALHDALAAERREIVDIVAPQSTSQAFAALTGLAYRTHVRLQLYRLDSVSAVAAAPGSMRQAARSDYELLCAWQHAFVREANVREGIDEIPQQVLRRLEAGGAWLWVTDGEPVSHAAYRATPIRSARIAPVYTPAEHRGRGYAAALVAAMSRDLLQQGRAPLYLYADMSNPTANGLYQRVGFRPVGEHLHLTRDGA